MPGALRNAVQSSPHNALTTANIPLSSSNTTADPRVEGPEPSPKPFNMRHVTISAPLAAERVNDPNADITHSETKKQYAALCQAIFQDADEDNSAFLANGEFIEVIRKRFQLLTHSLTSAEILRQIEMADANSDGKVSITEFASILKIICHRAATLSRKSATPLSAADETSSPLPPRKNGASTPSSIASRLPSFGTILSAQDNKDELHQLPSRESSSSSLGSTGNNGSRPSSRAGTPATQPHQHIEESPLPPLPTRVTLRDRSASEPARVNLSQLARLKTPKFKVKPPSIERAIQNEVSLLYRY